MCDYFHLAKRNRVPKMIVILINFDERIHGYTNTRIKGDQDSHAVKKLRNVINGNLKYLLDNDITTDLSSSYFISYS